jgi:hypothetical protein
MRKKPLRRSVPSSVIGKSWTTETLMSIDS